MKKLLFMLAIFGMCLPIFANEGTSPKDDLKGWSVWYLGDYKQSEFRVGYGVTDTVELGFSYSTYTNAIDDPPDVFGLYGIYDFPGEIDVNNLPLFGAFSDQISMASYIGYQGALELDDDGEVERGYHGPMVGLVLTKFIFDEVDDQIITGTEFQFVNYTDELETALGTDEEFRVLFFLRILF